jgi:acetyltransferase-like isoleucine patch superfamily enzyme
MKYIGYVFLLIKKGWQRLIWGNIQKSMMAECGKNVRIANGCDFTYSHLHIGNNVYLGPYTFIISPVSDVYIGNNVFFGPHVTVVSGDHRTDVIGEYMINVPEEQSDNYKDVIIEDDVWIGANVIILKGVTIGKGSVIGAGSVVNASTRPYSVNVGSLEHKTWKRFSEEDIIEHQRQINKNRVTSI